MMCTQNTKITSMVGCVDSFILTKDQYFCVGLFSGYYDMPLYHKRIAKILKHFLEKKKELMLQELSEDLFKCFFLF